MLSISVFIQFEALLNMIYGTPAITYMTHTVLDVLTPSEENQDLFEFEAMTYRILDKINKLYSWMPSLVPKELGKNKQKNVGCIYKSMGKYRYHKI